MRVANCCCEQRLGIASPPVRGATCVSSSPRSAAAVSSVAPRAGGDMRVRRENEGSQERIGSPPVRGATCVSLGFTVVTVILSFVAPRAGGDMRVAPRTGGVD